MYENALSILKIINEAGFLAYIVGGYSRDKYLGICSNDIDICTSAKPSDIRLIFDDVKINNDYGVSLVTYNEYTYEITTFRKDHYIMNGGHAYPVSFVSTLEEDLQRRDFVMNTLCIDMNGNYVDLIGAKDAIDKHVITCVKDPLVSFKEDPLRILRAIRFATILSFELSDDIKLAINEYSYLLKILSFDRRRRELDKLFSSSNVMDGIELIKKYNLGDVLSIDVTSVKYSDDYLGIWAQCNFGSGYNFSKKEKEIIKEKINSINII